MKTQRKFKVGDVIRKIDKDLIEKTYTIASFELFGYNCSMENTDKTRIIFYYTEDFYEKIG